MQNVPVSDSDLYTAKICPILSIKTHKQTKIGGNEQPILQNDTNFELHQ